MPGHSYICILLTLSRVDRYVCTGTLLVRNFNYTQYYITIIIKAGANLVYHVL